MDTPSSALDHGLDEAVSRLSAVRDQLQASDPAAASYAASLIEKLRALRAEPVGRRCAEAALLRGHIGAGPFAYSRQYDHSPPGVQRVMEAYAQALVPIREAAVEMLALDEVGDFLVEHADDSTVTRLLNSYERHLPARLLHRVFAARSDARVIAVGNVRLRFLGGGALVVVDGRLCYGPAKPDVVATAGHASPGNPRYVLQRSMPGRSLALDLDRMQVTWFQREGVARHYPEVESIDEDGVLIRLRNGETVHRGWQEFEWQPLKPFEAA